MRQPGTQDIGWHRNKDLGSVCTKVVKTSVSSTLPELQSLPRAFTSEAFAAAHSNLVLRAGRSLPLSSHR